MQNKTIYTTYVFFSLSEKQTVWSFDNASDQFNFGMKLFITLEKELNMFTLRGEYGIYMFQQNCKRIASAIWSKF